MKTSTKIPNRLDLMHAMLFKDFSKEAFREILLTIEPQKTIPKMEALAKRLIPIVEQSKTEEEALKEVRELVESMK